MRTDTFFRIDAWKIESEAARCAQKKIATISCLPRLKSRGRALSPNRLRNADRTESSPRRSVRGLYRQEAILN
jgi:hypothetical protein